MGSNQSGDDIIMSWGKFRGTALADIPASYLLYMYGKIGTDSPDPSKWNSFTKSFMGYVKANKGILDKEKESGTSRKMS